MAKYGTGELVRFKASELLVSAGSGSVKIGTDGLVGRITGSVETTGEETKYYVEVKLPNGTFVGVSCVTLKLTVLEGQIQSEKEHLDAKFDEFVKRVIPSSNPDPDSWIRSIIDNCDPYNCDPCIKKSFDATLVLKKCKPIPNRYYRAEREKVKKGRKFERCLRDSVVDEALERAIELLKGGAE